MVSKKLLPSAKVLDPEKTVISLTVRKPCLVHLTRQPLPAIKTNIDAEGKPGLYPHMELTKLGVLIVMVQMGAPARFFHSLGLPIPQRQTLVAAALPRYVICVIFRYSTV